MQYSDIVGFTITLYIDNKLDVSGLYIHDCFQLINVTQCQAALNVFPPSMLLEMGKTETSNSIQDCMLICIQR